MKTTLSIVGAVVITLALLGAVGIGHFRLSYGIVPESCVRVAA